MSTDNKPPDPKTLLWRCVSRCFSGHPRLAIVVFLLLLVAAGSWWQWDRVRQLPGIETIVKWVSQDSLPKADPKRFAVVLAHIEHDQNGEYERLITEALKEFEGIQLVKLDRVISLEGAYPQKKEDEGHKKAREYLQKIGGQVLIWGTLMNASGKTLPKIYLTTLKDIANSISNS